MVVFLNNSKFLFMRKIYFLSLIISTLLIKRMSAQDNLPFSVDCNLLTFLYTESGRVVLKFEAEEIIRDKSENIELPNGGKIIYYNEDGTIKFIAKAKTAKSNKDFSIWNFGGGVYLQADEVELQTENLVWKKEEQILETEDQIIINHKNGTIRGVGLYAKQDLSFYEIKKVLADIKF